MPPNNIIAGLALLAGLAATPTATHAAERRFTLTPGPVQVEFRAFGIGFLPITGGFARFSGVLTLDNADPARCAVTLTGDAASLRMPSQSMTDDALGKDLLDVASFPSFSIEGICEAGHLQGRLLMHGVTRPVVLDVTRTPTSWTATGLIDRRDWGMGARPLLAGPQVRLTVTAGLPPIPVSQGTLGPPPR